MNYVATIHFGFKNDVPTNQLEQFLATALEDSEDFQVTDVHVEEVTKLAHRR